MAITDWQMNRGACRPGSLIGSSRWARNSWSGSRCDLRLVPQAGGRPLGRPLAAAVPRIIGAARPSLQPPDALELEDGQNARAGVRRIYPSREAEGAEVSRYGIIGFPAAVSFALIAVLAADHFAG